MVYMIKIKKTKKQDYQDTINFDSKSQLAKLLATEDVTVQHNHVATASFDIANRVLTLPIFKIKDKNVYDMLIAHECGHALWTKIDNWKEISSDDRLRMAVNVLEDTRIDKMIQSKFPGIINDYKKGFDKLNNSDFYGLQDRDINTLSILDKINMRSKSLERMNITFTDEELEYVKKTDDIKTFAEVVKLAKEIIGYQKQKDQEQMINEGDITMPAEDNEDADIEMQDDDGEMRNEDSSSDDSSDDSKNSDDNSDDNSESDDSNPSDDDSNSDDGSKTQISSKGSDMGDDFGITNKHFESEREKLTDTNTSEKRVYIELSKPILKNIIIPYKDYFTAYGNEIDNPKYASYKKSMMSRYKQFKKDSLKTVNYLVKEFEMKKSATAYARANTAKTGTIDPMLLKNYKFSDDIFKKLTILPDAKNHGMIMLVDWSGSMTDIIAPVLQQVMNLVWFCKKINIPFEVYAFSDYYDYVSEYDSDWRKNMHSKPSFDVKLGTTSPASFRLVNISSHLMNNKDFEKGMTTMYNLLELYDRRSGVKNTIVDWSSTIYNEYPDSIPDCMHLGSTPLDEAMIAMLDIIPMFKKKYNIEKLSLITLSDGASNSSASRYVEKIDDDGTHCHSSARRSSFIKYKNKYHDFSKGSFTTNLNILIKKYNDVKHIGFFLLPGISKRHLSWVLDSYDRNGNYVYPEYEKVIKELKKTNCYKKPHEGYDEYYLTVGNTKVKSVDLSELSADAKTSDIKKLFKSSMGGRLKSRVLLNNFINQVA